MTDQTTELAPPAPTNPAPLPSRVTKASTVVKLLSRNRGATIVEMMAATNWQPHTTRAFLTGLRKKGHELLKESRRDGETSYRIAN